MAKITEETLKLNIEVNGDQTRKRLFELTQQMDNQKDSIRRMKKELDSLAKAGQYGTDTYKTKLKLMKDFQYALEKNKREYESLSDTIPIASKTLKELAQEERRLRALFNKAIPGTASYKELSKQLEEVRDRMKELRSSSKDTNNCILGLSQTTTNFIVGVKSVIDSTGWVRNVIKTAVDAFRDQDEAMTDAMKTTNLTKEEIRALSDELKKIDTRTAQNDLLGLVRIGGKLGVQGSENLLAFARAADKINVALKDDLGGDTEGAIATVGKLVNIFQLEGRFGLEDSLLKVGSAINDLGMASTANEGYIVDFTSRLAGIAPNANISITKVLGLGATLDKYGQQAERPLMPGMV